MLMTIMMMTKKILMLPAMITTVVVTAPQGKLVGNQVDMEMFTGVGFQQVETARGAKAFKLHDAQLTVVKQFEFVHALQTMAVIVHDSSGGHHAFCKGSYERVKQRLAPSSIPSDYDAVCAGLAKAGACGPPVM
jgi:magnesium-transporting ATPase (P-type)